MPGQHAWDEREKWLADGTIFAANALDLLAPLGGPRARDLDHSFFIAAITIKSTSTMYEGAYSYTEHVGKLNQKGSILLSGKSALRTPVHDFVIHDK